MSSKPTRSTHFSSSTSSSDKSLSEKEKQRASLLFTQVEQIYNQNLKQIGKEKRILEFENENKGIK